MHTDTFVPSPQSHGFEFEFFGELLSLRHRTPPGTHCPLFEVSTKVGLAQTASPSSFTFSFLHSTDNRAPSLAFEG